MMRPIPDRDAEKKKMKRELLIAISAACIIVIILIAATAIQRSGGELPFSGHLIMFVLIGLVILLLILIIFFLIRNFFKLIFERRGNVLGSHLKTRLTAALVALTLVPTVVLFIASAGILNSSIESWFKSQIEDSLQSSLVIAQAFYQSASEKLLMVGSRAAGVIASEQLLQSHDRSRLATFLDASRNAEDLSSIQLYFADGEPPILSKDPKISDVAIPPPIPSFLKIGFQGEKTSRVTSLDNGADLVSGIVPVEDGSKHVPAVIVVDYYIPKSLAGRLFAVSKAYGDYQEARRMKEPVKMVNVLILLLVALLVILIGFWFGITLARDITDPILNLSEGTEQIAAGDLNVYIEPTGDDELAVLVKSFNRMTSDLRRSRDELIRVNMDLESRRKYMETVLKNVAAGVLSINPEGRITTINQSAIKLLGITEKEPVGKPLVNVTPEPALSPVLEFITYARSIGGTQQKQINISFSDRVVSILCFAALLRDDEERDLGMALVFEDMTHLIKAQRMAAWREVARRIAHEIKNPLTPIQLNAQRMRRKYLDTLGEDGSVLDQCTKAIVDQVEQLKNMVNEFSQFARMPAANPVPNDLNKIIQETLALYSEGHHEMDFSFEPDASIPEFDLDKEQIKRALVNLLDNAVTATHAKGTVEIRTFLDSILSIVSMQICDNGSGIEPKYRERLFEPYFSRKPGGTGLGLSIVAAIVSDHNGFIRVKDSQSGGACFIIELPIRRK